MLGSPQGTGSFQISGCGPALHTGAPTAPAASSASPPVCAQTARKATGAALRGELLGPLLSRELAADFWGVPSAGGRCLALCDVPRGCPQSRLVQAHSPCSHPPTSIWDHHEGPF